MSFSVGERVAALRAFADLGYHKAKAAKLLGVTRTAVGRLCKAHGIEMVNKACTRDITLRRVAAMREMAELGRTAEQVSMLLEIDPARVSQLRKQYGITLKAARKGRAPWLQEHILRDYGKPGMRPSVMGERYGTSASVVSVRLSQLRKEGKLPPVQQRC